MDVSDFKDPSEVSSAFPGGEDVGMVRLARGSAYYWNSGNPGENDISVAQALSKLAVAAFHSSFTRRHHEFEAVNHLVAASRSASQLTGKEAQQELARGWRAILNLELDQAFAMAAALELDITDLPPPIKGRLLGEIQVLRAVGFAFGDNSAAAVTIASRQPRDRLRPLMRRLASTVCRFGYWKAGELGKLYPFSQTPVGTGQSRHSASIDVFDLLIQAAGAFQQLNVGTAKRMADDALGMAQTWHGEPSAAASFAASLIGQIAYEEGDLARAETALRPLLLQGPPDRLPIECLVRGYPIYSHIAAHRGEQLEAVQYLLDGENRGRARGSPLLIASCLSSHISLCIGMGALDEARECYARLQSVAYDQQRAFCGGQSAIAMQCILANARIKLMTSPCLTQVGVLRQLYRTALGWNDHYAAIVLAIRLVEALHIVGETEEASVILARALRITMNSGIFQTFIDGGNRVRALLIGMHNRPAPDWHDLLPFLSTLVRRLSDCPVSRGSSRTAARTRRILSPRECHILQLIGGGMSNKRIAQELKIAPETVKSHAKHIFVKLNVQTRAQAVARSVGLGLL
jgi:ATP/maltotriose-dependent transcriptional regulator MalT